MKPAIKAAIAYWCSEVANTEREKCEALLPTGKDEASRQGLRRQALYYRTRAVVVCDRALRLIAAAPTTPKELT